MFIQYYRILMFKFRVFIDNLINNFVKDLLFESLLLIEMVDCFK
jgi:hypothetical protein